MPRLAQRNSGNPDSSAKYGLLQIIRIRFRYFEEKFGRLPKPDEPLFFDESQSYPLKASIAETRAQLAQAAHQALVNLGPVLGFLGLAEDKAKSVPRPAPGQSARNGGRPVAQSSLSNRGESQAKAGWSRFLANERLHRRHRINRKELQAISNASFLGEARSDRDYLLVLKIIRQRTES